MKMKKFIAILSTAVLCGVCALSVACEEGEGNLPPVEEQTYTISLDKNSYAIAEDNTFTLNAQITPQGNIKWSSDNEAVASVDNGMVLCKQAGTATITAKCGNASASCVVTVNEGNQSFISLEASVSAFSVLKGGESVKADFTAYQVAPSGEKTKIENAQISYEIGDARLITLEGDEMRALSGQRASGTTSVTATYEGVTTQVDVTVYDEYIATTAEWNKMLSTRDNLGKHYLLTADLDFASTSYQVNTVGYIDITSKTSFRGTIEGNGHTLKNISLSGVENASLFGVLYGGKIRNLAFENVSFEGSNVCAIATSMKGTTEIENIFIDATFSSQGKNAIVSIYANGFNGSLKNAVIAIQGNSSETSFFGSNTTGFEQIDGVYVLSDYALPTVAGVKGYTSKINMAWDVNSLKQLPLASWNYFGGEKLPTLIQK